MKSPFSQMMMLILAIVFAVALTLTIATICLSYVRVEEDANTLPTIEQDTTALRIPTESETTHESTDLTEWTTTEEETTEETTEYGNGLSFSSNRNGTCTLIGMGTCLDACVIIPEFSPSGERVTAIDAYAFYGCQNITIVQVPAGVTRIGEFAFAGCNRLIYIAVSRENVFYRDIDGILYTADMSTLIAYPAMRAGSTVTIQSSTTSISDMAFYNCAYLSHIDYTGSAEQWERIQIGVKNYSLIAASKSFSGTK